MSLTLVFNAGSSSLKYQVFDGEASIVSGNFEKLKENDVQEFSHFDLFEKVKETLRVLEIQLEDIHFVGYRIVHGGEKFSHSIEITHEVIDEIRDLSLLAPLHIRPAIEVLKASIGTFLNAKHIAVFDTAFHATLDEATFTYPIPRTFRDKYGIRKFGFHGMSHKYVAEQAANQLGVELNDLNAITCHLGAGSSITAIRGGQSVDTSMGFTPLAGLMMATRSGDIDPGILLHLLHHGFSVEELSDLLNMESGLKAIAGTCDMREIRERAATDPDAWLAREMYIQRILHYIGAYLALVRDVEVIVFTGGIGENDGDLLLEIEKRLHHLGVGTNIKILVIPTNEELAIARECWKVGR